MLASDRKMMMSPALTVSPLEGISEPLGVV
jgi:hypothetical protein